MRLRGTVAAVAGAAGAAIGHALDVSGGLPLVHESEGVRSAMTPAQVLLWLLLAALTSTLAAGTRPLLVGAPAALAVSAAPELLGRHDVGAVSEPGALLGALLQLLLVVAVVALAVVLERRLLVLRAAPLPVPSERPAPQLRVSSGSSAVDRTAAPRAPPGCVVITT